MARARSPDRGYRHLRGSEKRPDSSSWAGSGTTPSSWTRTGSGCQFARRGRRRGDTLGARGRTLQYWCAEGRELFTTADRSPRAVAERVWRLIDAQRIGSVLHYVSPASGSTAGAEPARTSTLLHHDGGEHIASAAVVLAVALSRLRGDGGAQNPARASIRDEQSAVRCIKRDRSRPGGP